MVVKNTDRIRDEIALETLVYRHSTSDAQALMLVFVTVIIGLLVVYMHMVSVVGAVWALAILMFFGGFLFLWFSNSFVKVLGDREMSYGKLVGQYKKLLGK